MSFKRNSVANFGSQLNSISHISYPIAQIFKDIEQKSQSFIFVSMSFHWYPVATNNQQHQNYTCW